MRKIGKTFLFGLSAVALAAGIAWATFPAWAPVLVRHKLPQGWRLLELETARPALSSLSVRRLTLAGDLPGATVTLGAADLTFGWPGLRIEVSKLSLELGLAGNGGPMPEAPGPRLGSRWSVPRIIPPGGLPRVEIGRLEWAVTGLSIPQSGRIDDLVFGQDAVSAQLETVLNPIPLLSIPGVLRMRLSEDAVELSVETQAGPPQRLLYYRQAQADRRPATADPGALASLSLALGLEQLELVEVGRWLQRLGLGPVDRASGRVGIGVQFEGDDALYPVAVSLLADEVEIAAGEESLALGWAANAGVQGGRLDIEQETLLVQGTLAASRLRHLLERGMHAAGISAPLTSEPFSIRLAADDAWQARVDAAARDEFLASGSGSLEVRQGASGMRLDFADGRLHRRRGQAIEAAGAVSLKARFGDGLTLEASMGRLQAGSLEARLSGSVAVDDAGMRVERGLLDDLRGSGFRLDAGEYGADAAAIQLGGRFELGGRSRFEGQVSGSTLRVSRPEAQPPQSLFQAAAWSGQVEAKAAPATILAGQLRFDGVAMPAAELRMDGLDVEIGQLEIPALSGQLELTTTGLVLLSSGKPSSGVDAELSVRLDEGVVREGSGELLLGLTGALPVRFRADPATGQLVVSLEHAPLGAAELPALARALRVALPRELVFEGGRLEFDGDVMLEERDGSLAPVGELGVIAQGLALSLGETRVESLELTSRVDVSGTASGTGSLSVTRIGLAAGLELSGLSATFGLLDPDHLDVRDLRASLLDGTLESAGFSLVAGVIGDTTLYWRDFDLGRLLAFLEIEGLDGTGRVDASLPIVGAPGGLGLEDGTFRALGPGRIRYRTGLPAANVGMRALENFEYETLEGAIDYQADGHYAINIRLLGRNPDLYGGHPIRFQLNLSGDLPALFYSLFITGDFERAILEEVTSRSSEAQDRQQP